MSQPQPERDRLLEHAYDGIQEYDNPMPRWWVYIFWATIIFSVIYAMNVIPGWGSGPGRIAQYESSVAQFRAQHPQQGPTVSEHDLEELMEEQDAVADGKATYAANCAACHGPAGGGVIGPNLTDDHWIHGGSLSQIRTTVADGVLDKGMPAWNKLLTPEQVNNVVAYIASLRGTNPPGAKAPQGELVDPAWD